jgi:hypothetical protein
MRRLAPVLLPFFLVTAMGCASSSGVSSVASTPSDPRPHLAKNSPRAMVIARARVWQPMNVAAANMKTGPEAKNGFAFGEIVNCTYVKKALSGKSPKFACKIDPDDEVKVKYGGANGEVYGEVAATRLLWALGFGADREYPVKVICRDCPDSLNGTIRSEHERVFDPAIIERKMPGGATYHPDTGWSWAELDEVDEAAGGSPRAQRDALKLIAVFLQHTDSKPQQQRLICLDAEKTTPEGTTTECKQPFMLLNDVGLTFGRATTFNTNTGSGVNLVKWSKTAVWKGGTGCVGNLPKSMTGTLNDPVIGDAGRQFLADLLMQLSDTQIHDLFEESRVHLRLRDPGDVNSGFPTVDEWVAAFKDKREQIATRRCSAT